MTRANSITVSSGVSHRTGNGFVTLSFGDESGQLDVAEAIDFGISVITAAVSAEHDALVSSELVHLKLPPQVVAGFLAALRNRRGMDNVSGSSTSSQSLDPPEEP